MKFHFVNEINNKYENKLIEKFSYFALHLVHYILVCDIFSYTYKSNMQGI
jgi:hypothetical protein